MKILDLWYIFFGNSVVIQKGEDLNYLSPKKDHVCH